VKKYANSLCITGMIIILGIFLPVVSSAQVPTAFNEISFLTNTPGIGVKMLGMGGAGIGMVKGYSALYWNPAGLGFTKRRSAYFSLSNFVNKNDAIAFKTVHSGRLSTTNFNALGVCYPIPVYQGGLVFAGGVNRGMNFNSILSFQGFNDHPDDQVYQIEDISEEGGVGNIAIGGAVQVFRDVSIGMTLNIWRGSYQYGTFFSEYDDENLYTFDQYTIHRYIDSDITGVDLKLGIQYAVSRYFSIGVTLNTPRYLCIRETFEEDEETIFDPDIDDREDEYYTDSGLFKYRVRLPFRFGFGAALTFPYLTISGDLEYIDWSQARYLSTPPIEGMNRAEANRDIRSLVQSVMVSRLGAQLQIPGSSITLRGGYFEEPGFYKFSNPENTKKYVTAGGGLFLNNKVSIDAAYIHGWWKQTTIDDLVDEEILEDKADSRIYAGVTIHF